MMFEAHMCVDCSTLVMAKHAGLASITLWAIPFVLFLHLVSSNLWKSHVLWQLLSSSMQSLPASVQKTYTCANECHEHFN